MRDSNRLADPDETARTRRQRRATSTDRAFSDLIGYVLILAVILSSVAIVSTLGIDALATLRTDQQENNAEEAFSVMAENFDDIERGVAPSRTSEIDLHQGRMRTTNTSSIYINVTHPPDTPFETTVYPQTIRLRPNPADPETILYQNGATIRGTNGTGEGVIDNAPRLVCSEEQTIISLVRLNTSEDRQFGGSTVRITGTEERTNLIYPVNRTGDNSTTHVNAVNIEFDTRYNQAWTRYLLENNWDSYPSADDTVRCPTERVYIRETVITVQFVR